MPEAPPVLPGAFADIVAGYRWTRDVTGESGGAVFRLEADGRPPLYLKHGVGRVAADVFDEAARLAWLAGRLPVPTIRRFAADSDAAWLLTTAMPGRTGDELLAEDIAHLPAIIAGAAAFLKRIHALPVASCPFEAGHRSGLKLEAA